MKTELSKKQTRREEKRMENKKNNILDKAEDVIMKKIEHYGRNTEDMDKDDCYALQLLVITEGRIQSIRDGVNRERPY